MENTLVDPFKATKKKFIFSRIIDYCLIYLITMTAWALSPWFIDGLTKVCLICAIPLAWAPLGAIFLKYLGKTPGMMLFGLKAKSSDGQFLPFKMGFKQALLPFNEPKSGVVLSCQSGRLRHIAAVIIGLFCVFMTIGPREFFPSSMRQSLIGASWVQYTHPEEGFSIHFPSDPSEEAKEIEVPEQSKSLNYTEMSSQKRKAVYSLSYMHLPRKWGIAGDNTILKTCLELMIEFFDKSELLSKKMTYHKTYKALDFTYSLDGEEVRGRLVMVGNTLYKLAVQYPKQNTPSAEAIQGFFDSFEPKK